MVIPNLLQWLHGTVIFMSINKCLWSRSLTLLITIGVSLVVMPTSAKAAEVTTTITSPDATNNVSYVFTLKHPAEITCDWGKADPTYGAICNFELRYTINWIENRNTGNGTASGPLSATAFLQTPGDGNLTPGRNMLKVLSGGKDVTDLWNAPIMSGNRNTEKTLKIAFKFNGPTNLVITLADSFYPAYNKALTVVGPGIVVKGLTVEEAKGAKAAADKNSADTKAATEAAKLADLISAAEARAAADSWQLENKLQEYECQKGNVTKKFKAKYPTCPKGYINPEAKYKTYQAFQKCKLFQKNNFLVNVEIHDFGRTLAFDSIGGHPYEVEYDFARFSDVRCALDFLKAPTSILNRIKAYKGTGNEEKASWGNFYIIWRGIPEVGIDYTITQKN